ncbi:hypothetical protein ACQEU3_28995 [Spirillospora sp. CA-253888]
MTVAAAAVVYAMAGGKPNVSAAVSHTANAGATRCRSGPGS